MYDFKYVLKLNNKLIQILQIFDTKYGSHGQELENFEIHFETLCTLRGHCEFIQYVSCRQFELLIKSLSRYKIPYGR